MRSSRGWPGSCSTGIHILLETLELPFQVSIVNLPAGDHRQPEYLAIVAQWLRGFGVTEAAIEAARQESLVWALERGSRSGRVAYQFARDWAGRDHSADAAPAQVADDTEPDGLDRV